MVDIPDRDKRYFYLQLAGERGTGKRGKLIVIKFFYRFGEMFDQEATRVGFAPSPLHCLSASPAPLRPHPSLCLLYRPGGRGRRSSCRDVAVTLVPTPRVVLGGVGGGSA